MRGGTWLVDPKTKKRVGALGLDPKTGRRCKPSVEAYEAAVRAQKAAKAKPTADK